MTTVIGSTDVGVDFNIDELTTGTLDGTGSYDVIMDAVKAHLRVEYEAERITGTDYATAYVQATMSALQQATGFAIAKTKLAAELALLAAQERQINKEAELTDENMKLVRAQVRDIDKGVELKGYELNITLPKETQLLDKQIEDVAIGVETKQYSLDNIMPVELDNLVSQGVNIVARTALICEQINDTIVSTDIKEYQLEHILPIEKTNLERKVDLIEKELLHKQAQIILAEKEIAIKELAIELARYTADFKMPAEVDLIDSQADLYAQKVVTEKAQTDPSVIEEGSVVDINNDLIKQQIQTFISNTDQTAAKLLIDTWIVRHNNDPEGNLETAPDLHLTNADIGIAVQKIL